MKVYFIRHADTGLVKQGIAQLDDSPLDGLGKSQVDALVTRFLPLDINLIITSPLVRAQETAQSLANSKNLPAIPSPLFVEIRKPTEIIGKSKDDSAIMPIYELINTKYVSDPGWRYSDEENFLDAQARALAALDYLQSQTVDNIAVVFHANFMALLAATMLLGKDFTPQTFLKLRRFLRFGNTGITTCTYESGQWKLHTWNDLCHLDSISSSKLAG